jgi:serine/threonine-protein kinase
MRLDPGDAFGRYRIEAVLGQGGMGRVYRAYDTRLRRPVALKVLPSTESNEAEARVLREARAAAALNHPEAVAIFDVGEAATPDGESVPYIAMELVEGRSLRVLAAERPLDLALRLRWLASVARVLAAAHRLGLVHRDIKPENVVVRDDGAVRVLDFGLARHAPGEEADAKSPMAVSQVLTGEGVILGTPLYMSPEQLRGEPLDGRTDQFSWAVMAYELLSGFLPWKHRESVRVVAEILTGDPVPLLSVAPLVPPEIAAAIEKALAKDPAQRHASMDAIVEVLGGPERAPVVPTESLTLSSASRRPSAAPAPASSHRSRLLWLAAALVALSVGVAVWPGRSSVPPVVSAPPNPAGAPSAASSAVIRLTDLPAPASTSAEAVAAYLEGARGQHDGLNTAYRGYFRAIALDPAMSAAHLRLAEIFVDARQYGMARSSYARVLAYLDRLGERDRAVVTALEPGLVWDPVDWAESVRRLRALHEARPRDEDLLVLLSTTLRLVDPSPAGHAEARALLGTALDGDVTFGTAWHGLTQMNIAEGRTDEARATAERCLREAPRATLCLDAMQVEDSMEGNCRGMLSDSRRWIAISPDDRWGYYGVASALAALGQPWDSVEEAVSQAVDRMMPEDREARRHEWAASLATLRGDFARADASAQDLARDQAATYDARDHAIVLRVSLALERGDAAGAGALAAAYLRRREAFAPPTFDTDPTPRLLDAERQAGLLPAREARARGEQWRRDWLARLSGEPPPALWVMGEARMVETEAEAAHALASRPLLERLPRDLDPDAVGNVSLLARRYEEAEPLLRSAAHACFVLDAPFDVVRASLHLGLALEGRGDHDGACAAYREVLARWGDARPRSVTADRARERAQALRCAN